MASNLLDTIMSAQGGDAADALGRQLGLDRAQTEQAMKELLPALSSGMKRQVSSPQGLHALAAAVDKNGHDRYLDALDLAVADEGVTEGNGILGHLLGSKDASRAVADNASQQTGLSSGLLKKMLPMLASLAMGAVAKNMRGGEGGSGGGILGDILGGVMGGGQSGQASGGLGGMLGGLLGGGGAMGALGGQQPQQDGGLGGLGDLASMFDADGDGSAADDLLEGFFNRR
jgi:hypothetical protein